MKSNWKTSTLSEACIIRPPKGEARNKLGDSDFVSFVPMEDLGIWNKNINIKQERKFKEVSGSYTYFANGDVLLAKITPCFENGKLGIANNLTNGVGFGSSEYIVFRPSKSLLSEYLFYFLSDDNFREAGQKSMGGAVGHKRVAKEFIENYQIPLPPLPVQRRIVAILDEAFEAIAKAKENAEINLQNSKELFESYLQSIFTKPGEVWEKNKLGEVCEISSRLVDPRKPEFQNLIHIGAGNIEPQKGTLSDLRTAKEEKLISGKFLFNESMVLYSKIRPYLKKVVNCDLQGLCSADIYPLLPFKGKMVKDFLYHLLLSRNFTDYAIAGSQRAGMPKVNRVHLFAYKFYLPPLNVQKTIVAKLDTLSAETKKLEAIYQNKLDDLDELKKSILKKTFDGEL